LGLGAHTIPSLYSLADLIALRSITPIHTGVGRSSGIVDLPIQRDEYGCPCIYSSSIKGALKTTLLNVFMNEFMGNYDKAKKAVTALLGSEPEEEESFESSLAILDAYLLTMPVKSLKGVYVYVTSPLLLRRFSERLELLKSYLKENNEEREQKSKEVILFETNNLEEFINEVERHVRVNTAICLGAKKLDPKKCEEMIKVKELEDKVILAEEVILNIEALNDKLRNVMEKLVSMLELEKPLLVLHDDIAKEVFDRSLIRLARVRLKRETKIVETGPWTEEYLPPKTILYTLMLYKKPPLSYRFIRRFKDEQEGEVTEDDYLNALKKLRVLNEEKVQEIKSLSNPIEKAKKITEGVRESVRNFIKERIKGYLILGGHETIGKGIMKIEFLDQVKIL